MKKVQIITDSCGDLNAEIMKKYGIDYAKMSTVKDGVESPALLEWSADDVHAFYNFMRDGNRITTAQVSVEEFNRIFKKYLDEDCDIVYIACSSKQSGSVNTGNVVAQRLLADYPDHSIFCIDSLNSSIGEGILAVEAVKYAALGKSAKETADYIIGIRKNVIEFITVHTLEYLRKAGRVSASSAFFGNLMGVKPILVSDLNGAQAAYKKVKGRNNSIKEVVDLTKENILNPNEQTVYVVHADCSQTEIDMICDLLKEEIGCNDICVLPIGPIVGASVGPDCIGVFALGKTVTFCAG